MTESPTTNCTLCGEPMPEGETMFMYHGYSGPCPKPPLPTTEDEHPIIVAAKAEAERFFAAECSLEKANFVDGARFAVRTMK